MSAKNKKSVKLEAPPKVVEPPKVPEPEQPDTSKLDAAAAAYRAVYDSLDVATQKGAFTLKQTYGVYTTCQMFELYINRIITSEKKIKDMNIPSKPPVSNKDAVGCISELYKAADIGAARGVYKISETVSLHGRFSELREWLQERAALESDDNIESNE